MEVFLIENTLSIADIALFTMLINYWSKHDKDNKYLANEFTHFSDG